MLCKVCLMRTVRDSQIWIKRLLIMSTAVAEEQIHHTMIVACQGLKQVRNPQVDR